MAAQAHTHSSVLVPQSFQPFFFLTRCTRVEPTIPCWVPKGTCFCGSRNFGIHGGGFPTCLHALRRALCVADGRHSRARSHAANNSIGPHAGINHTRRPGHAFGSTGSHPLPAPEPPPPGGIRRAWAVWRSFPACGHADRGSRRGSGRGGCATGCHALGARVPNPHWGTTLCPKHRQKAHDLV